MYGVPLGLLLLPMKASTRLPVLVRTNVFEGRTVEPMLLGVQAFALRLVGDENFDLERPFPLRSIDDDGRAGGCAQFLLGFPGEHDVVIHFDCWGEGARVSHKDSCLCIRIIPFS